METWYKIACPGCLKNNWACDGDTNDFLAEDVEAIQCWNCDRKFWLDQNFAMDYYCCYQEEDGRSLDDFLDTEARVTPGLKVPDLE